MLLTYSYQQYLSAEGQETIPDKNSQIAVPFNLYEIKTKILAAVGFEPTPQRDWCLKPAP